jgi:ribosome recycling factor
MYVCENDRYCPTADTFGNVEAFQEMCAFVFGERAQLTQRGSIYVDETGVVVLRPFEIKE